MLRARSFAFTLLLMAAAGLADGGRVELVSKAPLRQAPDTTGGSFVLSERSLSADAGEHATERGRLSADGRYVAFNAFQDFEPAPAPNRSETLDVFLYDRATEDMTLVSGSLAYPGRGGNKASYSPVVSATGGFVAFVSQASDLVPRDFNLEFTNVDVFLYSPDPPAAAVEEKAATLTPVGACILLDTREDCNVAVLPFVAGGGEAHVKLEVNGYYE